MMRVALMAPVIRMTLVTLFDHYDHYDPCDILTDELINGQDDEPRTIQQTVCGDEA